MCNFLLLHTLDKFLLHLSVLTYHRQEEEYVSFLQKKKRIHRQKISTALGVPRRSPIQVLTIFWTRPDWPWDPPSTYTMGTGSFPGVKRRGVELNTHPN
jgi:hypothetical protein